MLYVSSAGNAKFSLTSLVNSAGVSTGVPEESRTDNVALANHAGNDNVPAMVISLLKSPRV